MVCALIMYREITLTLKRNLQHFCTFICCDRPATACFEQKQCAVALCWYHTFCVVSRSSSFLVATIPIVWKICEFQKDYAGTAMDKQRLLLNKIIMKNRSNSNM
jgi:hypothetical protein